MYMQLHHIQQQLLDTFLPRQCLGCGDFDQWLCTSCIAQHLDIQTIVIPVDQQSAFGGIHSVTTLGSYADPFWRQTIAQLKFHHVQEVSSILGLLLAEAARQSLETILQEPISVIPIPLHPARLRERGFNQTLVIAEPMADDLGATLYRATLMRVEHTPSQTTVAHEERASNVSSAFALDTKSDSTALYQTPMLLIDDVVTTGATTVAAASALQPLSAMSIHVLAVARGG